MSPGAAGGGMTLIQKLAQMSMSQYGADLDNIDPCTGARRTLNTNNNRSPVTVDDITLDDGPDVESQPLENKMPPAQTG